MDKKASLKELQQIPGVGKIIAQDLFDMGFNCIPDLKNQNHELLYIRHNELKGAVQDVCMLYTFKCAVYYAETPLEQRDLSKLKWWYWKGNSNISSIEMDKHIRAKNNLY